MDNSSSRSNKTSIFTVSIIVDTLARPVKFQFPSINNYCIPTTRYNIRILMSPS